MARICPDGRRIMPRPRARRCSPARMCAAPGRSERVLDRALAAHRDAMDAGDSALGRRIGNSPALAVADLRRSAGRNRVARIAAAMLVAGMLGGAIDLVLPRAARSRTDMAMLDPLDRPRRRRYAMNAATGSLRRRWPAFALIASLILNGFLVGMMVTDSLKPHRGPLRRTRSPASSFGGLPTGCPKRRWNRSPPTCSGSARDVTEARSTRPARLAGRDHAARRRARAGPRGHRRAACLAAGGGRRPCRRRCSAPPTMPC